MLDLAQRCPEAELMDDPALAEAQHVGALRGLERINWWSGSARSLWVALRDTARNAPRPLRVLDLATGAGDVPIRLWQLARRHGVELEIDACDVSARATAHARRRAARAGATVGFFQLDVMVADLPGDYDALTCSLFLHHLTDEHAVALLQRMSAAARRLIAVNDLLRCRTGLLLARLAPRVLTRSAVVHTDAVLSVRAAFTADEAAVLAARAGLRGARIERRWPARYLLTWHR